MWVLLIIADVIIYPFLIYIFKILNVKMIKNFFFSCWFFLFFYK